MDARCKALAEAVGRHVVEREFAELLDLFAPWLAEQFSASDLQDMIDAADDGLPEPAKFTLDEGMLELEELRTPSDHGPPTRPMPDAITAANYRGWVCIQFQPDPKDAEDFNACYDVWVALVDHGGETMVGYFEAAEAS
jgi:hypothetical protein